MAEISEKNECFETNRFPFKLTHQSGRENLVIPHWHKQIEIEKVLSGAVTVRIDGNAIRLAAGDILFVSSGCIHAVTADSEDAAIAGLVCSSAVFDNAIGLYDAGYYDALLTGRYRCYAAVRQEDAEWSRFNACVEWIESEYQKREPLYEMAIQGYLLRLLALFIRHNSELAGAARLSASADRFARLKPALDYMEQHYDEQIRISELCKLVNMSRCYFIKYFKKITGETPFQYMQEIRVKHALQLLSEPRYNITEIAEKTGFCNVNYFDRVFRAHFGCTPTSYRQIKFSQAGPSFSDFA